MTGGRSNSSCDRPPPPFGLSAQAEETENNPHAPDAEIQQAARAAIDVTFIRSRIRRSLTLKERPLIRRRESIRSPEFLMPDIEYGYISKQDNLYQKIPKLFIVKDDR